MFAHDFILVYLALMKGMFTYVVYMLAEYSIARDCRISKKDIKGTLSATT